MTLRLFASCAPGIEPWLATEISSLAPEKYGATAPSNMETIPGGVLFSGDRVTLAHALIGLGLASRLFVRIAEFPVRHFNELEKLLARVEWNSWLYPGEPLVVRATSKKSKLYHSGAIEERVLRVVRKALESADKVNRSDVLLPRTEEETPSLVVRLEHDVCTISLDVSGTPLHRRGYRKNPYRAPLREDLARALVVASGWDGRSTLLDPCCGAGTILIEAAIWAQGIPPGCNRSFAVVATPLGDQALLEKVQRSRLLEIRSAGFRMIGSDCDANALAAAQENWRLWFHSPALALCGSGAISPPNALGNGDSFWPTMDWIHQDVRRLELTGHSVAILTNPPWGDRIRPSQHLASVYQRLGDLRRSIGVRLALITSQRELAYKTGVRLHSAFLTDAGGVKANVFVE
ncbi:MAG: hypothetical protein JNK57_13690 [Planctomycetaceae bacterium]|nr:hypothetical protein [Planctomycetaceae bacterium]